MHNKLIRTISLCLITGLTLTTLSACSVKSKRQLMDYARSTYGDADLVGSHSDLGKKIVTVTMKDKDTGIEYKVTSQMMDVSVDGSSFGKQEQTSSDFEEKYYDYLLEKAGDDLGNLADKYNFSYELDYGTITITFADRERMQKKRQENLQKNSRRSISSKRCLLNMSCMLKEMSI